MHRFLLERHSPIYFKQVPQRGLQVFVSSEFLEVDIGYGAYAYAAAFKKDWKVLFDKSGTVDEKMRLSWQKHESASNDDEYGKLRAECADTVWHNLMHAATAIKRGQLLRAMSELELSRGIYIGLLGCRCARDIKRGRDLDKLPQKEKDELKRTLVFALSPDALWEILFALADAIYTELERGGEQAHISVNRAQVTEYISACRSLSRG